MGKFFSSQIEIANPIELKEEEQDSIALYYKENLEPKLAKYKEERKIAIASTWMRTIAMLIFVVVGLILLNHLGFFTNVLKAFNNELQRSDTIKNIIVILVISFIAILIFCIYPLINFDSNLNKNILPIILNFFDKDAIFIATPINEFNDIINRHQFSLAYSKNSNTLSNSYFNFITSNKTNPLSFNKGQLRYSYNITLRNYIKLHLQKTNIEIVNATLSKEDHLSKRNRKKNLSTVMIKIPVNKKFSGRILVQDESYKDFLPQSELKLVKLEDPQFEKIFEIYGDDQVEARYVLSVSLMEKLLELCQLFQAEISCSFSNQEALITFYNSYNSFGLTCISSDIDFHGDMKNTAKKIKCFEAIINTLNFDDKSGL